MTMKHSLAVVVPLTCLCLVGCYDVLITTKRGYYDGDNRLINISFTRLQFRDLYECLCQAATQKCSVQVSPCYWNTCTATSNATFERQQHLNDDLACKHYQCQYTRSPYSFVCSQKASVSCQSSMTTQSIRYQDVDCGGIQCVTFSWRLSGERVDYSRVPGTVSSCNHDCECSTGIVATPAVESTRVESTAVPSTATVRTTFPVVYTLRHAHHTAAPKRPSATIRPTTSKATTTPKTTTTTTTTTTESKTTATTRKTTTEEWHTPTTTPKGSVLTTDSTTPSTEVTSQHANPTAEANATALDLVSDSQSQNDPVPIIAGVVVALLLVAIIVVVSVFLWKRRKGKAETAGSDGHEYANLPKASVCAQESDAATKEVSLKQDPTSQYTNYGFVNGAIDYDQGVVKYPSPANQSYSNIAVREHADNQHYVNYEPSRSHTVAPVDGNQTKDTSLTNKGSYVSVTNTLEETDDFPNSIYSLADHNLDNDPEHLSVVSSSNTETNINNFHSQNSTSEPQTNATGATAATKSHPFNETDSKSHNGYQMEKMNDYTEPTVNEHSLDKATNPHEVYEFAKQTDGTISTNDYSLSNCDFNSDTEYSIASNPANGMDKATASRPHVYSTLGQNNHITVNPYDALQQTIDAPVHHQVNPQQFKHGKSPDEMDLYSVAEPIHEFPPQDGNDCSQQVIDSGANDELYVNTFSIAGERAAGDRAAVDRAAIDRADGDVHSELFSQLDNPSSCQQPNNNIYFEL